MDWIVLVELNLGLNFENIPEPDQNSIFGCHASLNEVIDFDETSSLFFLIFLDDLSDLIEELLELEATDLDLGLVINFVDQFISLLLNLVVGGILLRFHFFVFSLALL